MASVLFTKFLACSVGMGLFIALMITTSPHWSRFFAAKWSVRLWAVLSACLCLPLAPGIPAVEAFFTRYPWIIALWLLIAALIVGYGFYRQSRFRKETLNWSNEPKNNTFAVKAARLAEELDMPKCPSIRVTARVFCPTVIALGEPILLLPHEQYTDTEFDIIIRHEFYHYLHGHIPYKVFLSVVNALHWFNPAVWMMREKAETDLEAACDDALLADASEKTRRQYSETILSVMQSPSGYSTPFSTHTYGSPMATGRRLIRLLSAPPKTGGAALLCLAVILSFLSGTAVATATSRLEAPAAPATAPHSDNDAASSSFASSAAPFAPVTSSEQEAPDIVPSVDEMPDTLENASSNPVSAVDELSSASENASDENLAVSSSEAETESSEPASSDEETEPSTSEAPVEGAEDVPSFPMEAARAAAEALPDSIRSLNLYAENFLGTPEGLEGITVPVEKISGMPSDEALMVIANRVIDAYNNGTADTSMSDPDAPRLMPKPDAVGDIPRVASPDEFTALPRTSNGYSIVVPIEGTGRQLQIWVDDNGPADAYSFDIVAVNFASE